MKHKFTLLLALLCASMMTWAATQYCDAVSPNPNFTFSLTNISGNRYRIQFDAIGDEKFASVYNINCGINQSGGAGIFFGGDNATNWVITEDKAYLDFTTDSETSTPTSWYGNYFCFNKVGEGLIEINGFAPTNVDWTATCESGECTDTEKPSISAATISDITYNSAVLTVTATDNEAVSRYVIKNGDVQIGSGNTDVITLKGLTSNTTYSLKVFAYDACNNESDGFVVTDFKTENRESECIGAKGHFGNPSEKKVYYQIDYENYKATISLRSLTGYDLDFAEVNIGGTGGGNYAMNADGMGGYIYTINTPVEGTEWYIRFLYSDKNMGGNEQTSQNLDASDANAIYYKIGQCISSKEKDVNVALASNGTSAIGTEAENNSPSNAIDGNIETRWSSEWDKDPQDFILDLGQRRAFNTIQFVWYTTYSKAFDILISDDQNEWVNILSVNRTLENADKKEEDFSLNGTYTARYIKFHGTERGAGYGHSFREIRVILPGVSTLTTIDLNAANTIAKVGEGIALTAAAKDQNGVAMDGVEITYEVSPMGAGNVVDGKYIPAKIGEATIVAKSGEVVSKSIKLYGYTGENVALEKNVEASGYDETNNLIPGFAVDNNEGSLWSAFAGETGAERVYDAWIIVDLGAYYDLNLIAIRWQGACSKAYHVDFSANKTDWRVAYNAGWNAIEDHWEYLCGTVDNTKVRYVRVWSTEAVSQYGVKIMDLKVFGEEWVPSSDTEKPVMGAASLASNTYNSAIINVSATDNTEIKAYHVVDATNGIDVQVVAIDDKITLNDLMDATTYNLTITAIDMANNESDNNAVVTFTTPFNAAANLALNKSCEAGYYDGNPAESADKVNDGDVNTAWVTYADQPASKEWWYVDLGRNYQLNTIKTMWGDVYSTEYILQIRTTTPAEEEKADDTAWTTLATITDATANGEVTTSVAGVGRYVRIHSLSKSSNFFRLRELQVFGTSVVNDDTEKPVMSDASLISNDDSHAVISVSATDNNGVASYRVEDTENGINAILQVVDGKVLLEGLAGSTTYTITIKAIDFFGNESDNSKTVTFTTTLHLTAPTTAAPVPTWPADQVKAIYSPTYSADCGFGEWGSGSTVTNDTYGKKYLVGNPAGDAGGYFGMVDFTLNCISMEKLHYDIWVADNTSLRIVPIWGGAEQGITVNLVGQQWNSIDIALSDYTSVTNWGEITQVKIDQLPRNINLWIGNAYFYRTTALEDSEKPADFTAILEKSSFKSVIIKASATDNMGSITYVVKNGETEVATTSAKSGDEVVIQVLNLTPNTNYTFTVIAKDEVGNEADPITINATTIIAPVAAPTPDFSGKNVLPIFTDAMAGGPATIHSGGWGETTIPEWLDLTENDKVFYAQKFNFAGWHSFGEIDATGMAYLHIDFYSIGMTQVSATPISVGHEGVYNVTLTPNTWTSVDIPLSAYAAANIEWSKIFQFKFMNPVDGNEFFVDNVYFWQPIATTTVDGWGTFASAGNVQVPTGVKAYKAAYSNNGGNEVLVLTELADGVIPAGEGVLIEGAASTTYGFTSTATTPATDMTDNDLIGTTTLTDVSAQRVTSDIFCLRRTELFGTTAFCLYSGQYIPAGKAYLALPQINGQAGAPRNIRMVFNTATGIEDVQGTQVQSTKVIENGQLIIIRDGKRYNAQGARVQ